MINHWSQERIGLISSKRLIRFPIFSGIEEKPTVRNFVAAGIYYISSEIQSLVSREKSLDMPSLLNQSRELGMKIGIFPISDDCWSDVGQWSQYNDFLKNYEK